MMWNIFHIHNRYFVFCLKTQLLNIIILFIICLASIWNPKGRISSSERSPFWRAVFSSQSYSFLASDPRCIILVFLLCTVSDCAPPPSSLNGSSSSSSVCPRIASDLGYEVIAHTFTFSSFFIFSLVGILHSVLQAHWCILQCAC